MAKKSEKKKKVIRVRTHPRRYKSKKSGATEITIVDEHPRVIDKKVLTPSELLEIFNSYNQKGLVFPTSDDLEYKKNGLKYDALIAVWTDYFNKIHSADAPIDPNVVKALIGSESGFQDDPLGNDEAFGIAQITLQTLGILLNPKGEAKDFIFKNILEKDLKNPAIAIPLAIRWLHRKKRTAKSKLGREPNAEELILEYKGLLKSRSKYTDSALKKFRKLYAKLSKR